MQLTVTQAQGHVPVTVVGIAGDLDGSNYGELIRTGHDLYTAGSRDILLDLREMRYMSSAGIVALHNLALMLRGEKPPDPDAGWESLHAVTRDQNAGPQQHLKLLSPQPRVDKILDTVGFKRYFDIHADLTTAVASFS